MTIAALSPRHARHWSEAEVREQLRLAAQLLVGPSTATDRRHAARLAREAAVEARHAAAAMHRRAAAFAALGARAAALAGQAEDPA